MGDSLFLETGAVFLVVIALALVRLGWKAGGWHWAAAWFCLWSAGISYEFRDDHLLAAILYPAFGIAFAALTYSGSCVFSGHPVPRWLVPLAIVVAALRGGLEPILGEATLLLSTIAITAGALGGSYRVLRPRHIGRRAWNVLLAAALPINAVATCTYTYFTLVGGQAWESVFLWLVSGISVGGIQVIALLGRVAQRAENQRALLAAVIDSVPVGLALLQPDGTLVTPNRRFQKLLPVATDGPSRADAIVGRLRDQIEDADRDAFDASLAGGPDPACELSLRDGTRLLSSTWPVVEPASGGRVGRLWQLVDVTEERQLQESFERARRLETLGGFAGGVAHDFNNQLTAVLGNTALLRDSVAGDAGAEEILDDLESSAQYCANLTQDVLDFARRRPAQREALDLAKLLPDILRRYADHPVGVALLLGPGLPPILADPRAVLRVVCNLVDNAHAAVGKEGRVEVRATRHAPDRIAIEVTDDGPGMDERLRARIFDPFFTTKPVGEGTGLGLAIVYGTVSVQGGEVRAESRPGHGTRMITTWAVAHAELAARD